MVKSLGAWWILSQYLKEDLGHKLEEKKKVRIRNGLQGAIKKIGRC